MKRHMRKGIERLLPLLWAVFLMSCSKEAANPGVAVKEKEGDEMVIGVAIYDYQDDFMTLYRNELEQYLNEAYGVQTVFMDSEGKEEVQERKLEEFLETGPDGVIVNPVEPDHMAALTDLCAGRGIPVVFINREPEEEEIERWEKEKLDVCYVGTDRAQAGTYQGEIIRSMPDGGDRNGDGILSCIFITGDDSNPDGWYRKEYAIKALKDGGASVDILFEGCGSWQEKEGERLAEEALSLYGDRAEVILCGNDSMAIGAERAVRRAGKDVGKDIYLVGVDALRPAVEMVKEGRMSGTVLNDYKTQAHMAADAVVAMAKGKKEETVKRAGYIKIVMGK